MTAMRKMAMMIQDMGLPPWLESLIRFSPPFVTFAHRSSMNSDFSGPFREPHSYPAMGKRNRVSSIIGLLNLCRPIAIGRFIVAIIIFALNAKFFRWMPHIRKKVVETHPAITNLNAARPIQMKIAVLWIGASLQHLRPYFIGSRSTKAMLGHSVFHVFNLITATRLCGAALKGAALIRLNNSAHASTNPHCCFLSLSGDFVDDGQVVEDIPNPYEFSSHRTVFYAY
jgi:hypothetical protein